jgi:hypothetical protein
MLFVIIFSQATKGPSIDAYTVKKIMPRLLITAILINISIYLVSIALDLTNVIGMGLRNLILGPLIATGQVKIDPGGLFTAIGVSTIIASVFAAFALFKAGALMAVMQFFLLFVVLPAAIAIIGVMLTLIIRQGIIIFLVIVSPIAFALYCLPNTEQYFQKWWDLLFKTLLVYPIIMVIFSISQVMAAIFGQTK